MSEFDNERIFLGDGRRSVCKKGMELKVVNDCIDEKYLYEMMNYPRTGLVKNTLKKGDLVEVVEVWRNFYGVQIRCKHENHTIDVKPINLGVNDIHNPSIPPKETPPPPPAPISKLKQTPYYISTDKERLMMYADNKEDVYKKLHEKGIEWGAISVREIDRVLQ